MRALFLGMMMLPAFAEAIRGRVLDAVRGEPIAGVRVSAGRSLAATDSLGMFEVDVPLGRTIVQFTAINYGLLKQDVDVRPGGAQLDVRLHQDAASISTRVEVTGALFEGADGSAAASQQTLSKNDLQSLGTMIVADPLRAVQALPSVTTSNDARGEISIRGSSFNRVAVLVDGILVDGFLHQAQGDNVGNERDRASFSILSTDRIASVNVLSGALPAKYGQRTAGVVAFETREGNRAKPDVRITTGFQLGTSIVVDGPLAKKRASYLIGVRSSSLDYIAKVTTPKENQDSTVFNDGQAKFTFDLTSTHKLTASSFFGAFRDDLRKTVADRNAVNGTRAFSLAAILGWDWTARPNLFLQTKLFHLETNLRLQNRDRMPLFREPRREWGMREDFASTFGRHQLAVGAYLRRIDGEGFAQAFGGLLQNRVLIAENYRGRTFEQNYYAQDTFRLGKLALTAGLRAERNSITRETTADPRLAVAWGSADAWQIRAGYSRNHQFPELSPLLSLTGNRNLRAERTHQTSLAMDRALGERSRISLELFQRLDRQQIFALDEPRLLGSGMLATEQRPLNSLSGRSRGLELMLQRRSANRFSGWVSYAYLLTRFDEATAKLRFPADADQRHAARVFANYRIGSNWNLSSLWRYGTGQPITGFITRRGGDYFLTTQRNTSRLPNYSRLDVRLSKGFSLWRSRWTFGVEGVNLLGRKNLAFNGIEKIDANGKISDPTSFFLGRFITLGVVIQF